MIVSCKKNGKRIIKIWVHGFSQLPLELLERAILNDMVKPSTYNLAILKNTDSFGDEPENPDNYPLKFYSPNKKEQLWVSGIISGSRDNPYVHVTEQILVILDFQINQNDIFSLPVGKQLTYLKKK